MSEQVVFACTIYDMCKQQDCLTPKCTNETSNNYLIAPAKNGSGFEVVFTDEEVQANFYVQPNEVYYITDDYKYVNVVNDTFETVMKVISFSENLMNKGFYDLEIQYRFNYALEFFNYAHEPIPVYIQNTPIYQVQAYSLYTKTVTLYGGEIKDRVTTLTSCSGQSCSKLPEYNIQSVANVLQAEICPITELKCNPYVDQTKNNMDDDGAYTPCITIGLFTVISLARQNRINILTGESMDIPTCDNPFNPCEDFNSHPFPYNCFDSNS